VRVVWVGSAGRARRPVNIELIVLMDAKRVLSSPKLGKAWQQEMGSRMIDIQNQRGARFRWFPAAREPGKLTNMCVGHCYQRRTMAQEPCTIVLPKGNRKQPPTQASLTYTGKLA
jgi:hypothetical protein